MAIDQSTDPVALLARIKLLEGRINKLDEIMTPGLGAYRLIQQQPLEFGLGVDLRMLLSQLY